MFLSQRKAPTTHSKAPSHLPVCCNNSYTRCWPAVHGSTMFSSTDEKPLSIISSCGENCNASLSPMRHGRIIFVSCFCLPCLMLKYDEVIRGYPQMQTTPRLPHIKSQKWAKSLSCISFNLTSCQWQHLGPRWGLSVGHTEQLKSNYLQCEWMHWMTYLLCS